MTVVFLLKCSLVCPVTLFVMSIMLGTEDLELKMPQNPTVRTTVSGYRHTVTEVLPFIIYYLHPTAV